MGATHVPLITLATGSTGAGRLALTVSEAAKAVGLSRSRFYIELSEGRIAAKKLGTRTIVPIDSLRAWLEALPAGGPPKAA
jgi:excisionase family DNA binding protein